MSKLEDHKNLYKFLNEARKRCKSMTSTYAENYVRLQMALSEKERLSDLIVEEQRKQNSFIRRMKMVVRSENPNDVIEKYKSEVETVDELIEELTKVNYEHYKQIHDDLTAMQVATSRLAEKHKFLQEYIAKYMAEKTDTFFKEAYINQYFPRYSEIMRKCEAVLLFLKDYIMKNLDVQKSLLKKKSITTVK